MRVYKKLKGRYLTALKIRNMPYKRVFIYNPKTEMKTAKPNNGFENGTFNGNSYSNTKNLNSSESQSYKNISVNMGGIKIYANEAVDTAKIAEEIAHKLKDAIMLTGY